MTALTGVDHIPLMCTNPGMPMRPVHVIAPARILHALKLHGTASAEADQHIAIERAADRNAGIVRTEEVGQPQHILGNVEVEDRIDAVAVSDKVDVGIGALPAFQRVIAADALDRGDAEIGVERIVAGRPFDDVAADPADHHVVAGIAVADVVIEPAVDRVIAVAARDLVVAAVAE